MKTETSAACEHRRVARASRRLDKQCRRELAGYLDAAEAAGFPPRKLARLITPNGKYQQAYYRAQAIARWRKAKGRPAWRLLTLVLDALRAVGIRIPISKRERYEHWCRPQLNRQIRCSACSRPSGIAPVGYERKTTLCARCNAKRLDPMGEHMKNARAALVARAFDIGETASRAIVDYAAQGVPESQAVQKYALQENVRRRQPARPPRRVLARFRKNRRKRLRCFNPECSLTLRKGILHLECYKLLVTKRIRSYRHFPKTEELRPTRQRGPGRPPGSAKYYDRDEWWTMERRRGARRRALGEASAKAFDNTKVSKATRRHLLRSPATDPVFTRDPQLRDERARLIYAGALDKQIRKYHHDGMPDEHIVRLLGEPVRAYASLMSARAPESLEDLVLRILRQLWTRAGDVVTTSALQTRIGGRCTAAEIHQVLEALDQNHRGAIVRVSGRSPLRSRGPIGERLVEPGAARLTPPAPLESREDRALRLLRELWAEARAPLRKREFLQRMHCSASECDEILGVLERREPRVVILERYLSRGGRRAVRIVEPAGAPA